MNKKQLLRFAVFCGILYGPWFALWALQLLVVLSLGFIDDVALLCMAGYVCLTVLIMRWTFSFWLKSSQWIVRAFWIDLGWILILTPLMYILLVSVGGMSMAAVDGGASVDRFSINVLMELGRLMLLVQAWIVPWTLLGLWLMAKAEKKWFNSEA